MLPDILEKLWALELKDWSPQVLQAGWLLGELACQGVSQVTCGSVGP